MTDVAPDQVLGMAREWVELDMPLNHEVAMSIVRGLLARDQAVRPVLDAAVAWEREPDPLDDEANNALMEAAYTYRAALSAPVEAGATDALASLCCDEINPATGYRCRRPPIHDAGLAKGDRFHVQIDKAGRTSAWTAEAGATEPAADDIRDRLRRALGHDELPDDDGLIGDVEEWIRRARAFGAPVPEGYEEPEFTRSDIARVADEWDRTASRIESHGQGDPETERIRAGIYRACAVTMRHLVHVPDTRALAEAGAPAQPGTDVIARLTAARDAGRATAERMYRGHPVEAEQADSWRDALDDLDYLATVLEAPHDDVARAILAALAGAADTEEPEEVPWFRCGNRPAAHHVRTSDLHWGGTVLSTDCGTVVTADEIADARPGQLTCRVCEAAARRANRPSFVLPEHPDALDLDAALAGRTNEEKTDV